MTRKTLTKNLAAKNSIREACIDSTEDVWIKFKTPSPTILMELESAGRETAFPLIFRLVQEHLVEPHIVETPSDNENEITMDELGGYFLPIATAMMDAVDVTGEARERAKTFLANQPSSDGRNGGVGVSHATERPPVA